MTWEYEKNMYCIRCGSEYAAGDYFKGCPSCLTEGKPASVSFPYQTSDLLHSLAADLFPITSFLNRNVSKCESLEGIPGRSGGRANGKK